MRPSLVPFKPIRDARGALVALEQGNLPFRFQRVYYLYDIEAGASRAGHAHKTLEQCIIAVSGAFDVFIEGQGIRTEYHLSKPHEGLYIPPMYWREINGFTVGAVCLVLASAPYDEGDYIRDYGAFKEQDEKTFLATATPLAVWMRGDQVTHGASTGERL